MKLNGMVFSGAVVVGVCLLLGSGGGPEPIPSTLDDFFQPGSQPNGKVVYDSLITSTNCRFCHEADGDTELPIYPAFAGSMMAHAARDPMFFACLAIANQDAAESGDLCLRCHMPIGWIAGRSSPADGSALLPGDLDGVSCSVCHRMVDPEYQPGVSPPADESILAAIDPLPSSPGGGNYVLDPQDVRRGPYDDAVLPGHLWAPSPLHRSSRLCATCHDVSNPMYERQDDDTYTLTPLDEPHPTADKYDMFPLERTYSEWLHSAFADGGVDMGGRFGGNIEVVSTCQDCHMPKTTAKGCRLPQVPERDDIGRHEFSGANAWALQMVANLYPDEVNLDYIEDGRQRAISMLQRAASLFATQAADTLRVRVYNETGHKLPSGYPEGRRMWLHVVFEDDQGRLLQEHGHYDPDSAELSTSDTRVYELHAGLDDTVAGLTGLPPGESFHFALNNVILKDNRIPPRGFTNEAFTEVQAAPVAATYQDGQYWDDTVFDIPKGATRATVELHYQTASKEYISFLRDENHTNDAGDILYEQWELTGKSPPVLMAEQTLELSMAGPCSGVADCADPDGDGVRNDRCLWWSCESGTCQATDVVSGDLGGRFGGCAPDAAADGHDHFHALNCFADTDTFGEGGYPCADAPAAFNTDLAGPDSGCTPDGLCDGHDAFAALDAFAGLSACSCPLDGPLPTAPAVTNTGIKAHLRLVPRTREVIAGGMLQVDVLLDSAVPNLRGYQLHIAPHGARDGLSLQDIEVHERADGVFAAGRSTRHGGTAVPAALPDWSAYNLPRGQMVAGLDAGSVATQPHGYLATFVFRVDERARGDIPLRLAERTFLFAAPGSAAPEITTSTATISVSAPKRQRLHRRSKP